MTCRKSKIIFQDHNRPLSWENVELRGSEPLTFCMPCIAILSECIGSGRVTAGQNDIGVWVRRAVSAVA